MSGYGTSALRRRPRVTSASGAGSHQPPVRLWTDASGKVGVIATLRSMPDGVVERDLAGRRHDRIAGHAIELRRSLPEDLVVPGGRPWCGPLRTTFGKALSHSGPGRVDDGCSPALLLCGQPGSAPHVLWRHCGLQPDDRSGRQGIGAGCGSSRYRGLSRGGCRRAEVEAISRSRSQHGCREINVAQQVGRIRAVFVHGSSDSVGTLRPAGLDRRVARRLRHRNCRDHNGRHRSRTARCIDLRGRRRHAGRDRSRRTPLDSTARSDGSATRYRNTGCRPRRAAWARSARYAYFSRWIGPSR